MRSFDAAFAFAAACSLAAGLGCAARIQPIHGPPTPAEIREINAPEAPIDVEPLPTAGWGNYKGRVDHIVSADAEKIVVAREGTPFAFRLADVDKFHLRRTGRGAAIGAGVGAGIGALIGFGIVSVLRYGWSDPDTSGFPVGPAAELVGYGAFYSSGIGALIGAMAGSPKDFPVVLGPAPPSEYGSPTPAPVAAGRNADIHVVDAKPVLKVAAIVVAPSAEVRSAPFKVAPVIATLPRGQRLDVEPTPKAGWRVAFLSDGRVGFIQAAQLEVDTP
jgi:hypothetical protein